MKVKRIQLNCHRDTSFGSELCADPVFIFFRTPVNYRDNNKEYATKRNSAVLLSSGFKQTFSPVRGKTLRYDIVSFSVSNSEKQFLSSVDIMQEIPMELDDDYVISSILRSMKSQSMHKGKLTDEFMELSMRLILIVLKQLKEGKMKPSEETIPKLNELKKLRDAIYDEPMNVWSVDEICDDMKISRTYFHRLYMKAFSVTFRQDVIESRLIHASDLLKNTDLSVTAISEVCGYDSESYFMRQFKKHKGCTPSEFRRKIKEQEE